MKDRDRLLGIVVLNWNRRRDMIDGRGSLFQLDLSGYLIVVVDNGSTDGSVERICAWVDGFEQVDLGRIVTKSKLHDAPPPSQNPSPSMVTASTSLTGCTSKISAAPLTSSYAKAPLVPSTTWVGTTR